MTGERGLDGGMRGSRRRRCQDLDGWTWVPGSRSVTDWPWGWMCEVRRWDGEDGCDDGGSTKGKSEETQQWQAGDTKGWKKGKMVMDWWVRVVKGKCKERVESWERHGERLWETECATVQVTNLSFCWQRHKVKSRVWCVACVWAFFFFLLQEIGQPVPKPARTQLICRLNDPGHFDPLLYEPKF